jgi:hypothetical protein
LAAALVEHRQPGIAQALHAARRQIEDGGNLVPVLGQDGAHAPAAQIDGPLHISAHRCRHSPGLTGRQHRFGKARLAILVELGTSPTRCAIFAPSADQISACPSAPASFATTRGARARLHHGKPPGCRRGGIDPVIGEVGHALAIG